ncbi:hypothetical protein FJU54_13470 [Acinetobacter baumannii]|uniref:hypothetical protein n=1 Tax=Acinetobacter baumannii TaxID=470 RepID=UPI00112D4191|nr:hypothetical protein [Acinetobacter baumannii]TPT98424.1 hypothetical protein FJU54_13470 [Acinetobacter baumannii]
MDKCREEFEQYIRDQSAFTADFQIGCNGQYKSDLMHFMFVTWQHQQAKVEELKASHHGEVIGHEVHFKKIKQERDELQTLYTQQGINMLKLQKRVQFLEQELGAWKGKSIAAMINGMCKQCGKEPWQAIVSDKDGYALLHCFGCGANKYELVGEQALKGEG